MKEQLYSIPVNDAFAADCECPICAMHKKLEDDAVDYTMGPSYMEDDTRAMTDEAGFCDKHIAMVYHKDNRLGMAWVMKTHFDKTINDLKGNLPTGSGKILKKGASELPAIKYLDNLDRSCFVCDRINAFFDRYIDTIFFLWKSDLEFREKYRNCKGFCSRHYSLLIKRCAQFLKGNDLEEFVNITGELYITNMERVRDDIEWFINKFDYRYNDEPWKNAKDSLIRGTIKTNGVFLEQK
ncbi:MAG: DUF6062 family protein [Butyrivibrio sp.]